METTYEETEKRDLFGFLPVKQKFEFDGGTVAPTAKYDEASSCRSMYESGWLHLSSNRKRNEIKKVGK